MTTSPRRHDVVPGTHGRTKLYSFRGLSVEFVSYEVRRSDILGLAKKLKGGAHEP